MNNHKCEVSLNDCDDHPRWHAVCAPSMYRRGWNIYDPRGSFQGWMPSLSRTVTFMTERARAERLAAVQSAEGQAAS